MLSYPVLCCAADRQSHARHEVTRVHGQCAGCCYPACRYVKGCVSGDISRKGDESGVRRAQVLDGLADICMTANAISSIVNSRVAKARVLRGEY